MSWSWQGASDYMKDGRKKHERPLYDRGLRIWKENRWDPDSDISIGWKYSGVSQTFVTYHKDGTTTIKGGIQTNSWGNSWNTLRGQSVRLTIHRYAGIQVLQRNFNFYLQEDGAALTPAKIQGCRTCSQTGLVDSYCGPIACNKVISQPNGSMICPEHPDAQLASWRSWHYTACEHGFDSGHTLKRSQQCYYCKGTKKRDYGSKPIRTMWDGSPLRLRDGKIINSMPTLLERMLADYVQPIS
jgi:hypothetical protein